MKIHLTQEELAIATREFIANQGIPLEGKVVDVKFTATRSDAGIIAEVSIERASAGDVGTATNVPTAAVGNTKPALVSKSTADIAEAARNAPLDEAGEEPVKPSTSLFGS